MTIASFKRAARTVSIMTAGLLFEALLAGPAIASERYETSILVRRSGAFDTPISIFRAGTTPQAADYVSGLGAAYAVANDEHGGTAGVAVTVFPYRADQATNIVNISAEATVIYQFMLDGPDPKALVPVLVNAVGGASGSIIADASFSFTSPFSADRPLLYHASVSPRVPGAPAPPRFF